MAETWIVAADSARAKIFAVSEQGDRLEERKSFLHPASRAREGELTTDRHGRSFDSRGEGRHAMSANVSPKEHEAALFSKVVADEIEAGRIEGRFDRLALIASPAFLGLLRKSLSDTTVRLVAFDSDKNVVHLSPEGIREHLPDELFE